MVRKVTLFVAGMALVLAAPAFGDWDPEQASKWVQFPDLSPMGIDVNATGSATGGGYILADDFLCDTHGPITDIHIWGSWLYDELPGDPPDPNNVTFTLSIHEDIPSNGSPTGYSMPGEVKWVRTFYPGEFTARIWASGIEEGWMNPPEEYFFPADWTCWQYNFFIDEAEAFIQEGTTDEPIVYWLDVQAIPNDLSTRFGWKTSLDHWNDDAVWGQGQEPYPGPWQELRYPPQHEMYGQSIDLAFVITTKEEELDFGDAPDSTVIPQYPTLLANNGARHTIVPGVYMGFAVVINPDAEPDGQPDPNALGDDNDILYPPVNDDEDGVAFVVPLVPGVPSSVDVTASVDGQLDAWIDFDGDGSWAELGDQIAANLAIVAGTTTVNFVVPATAVVGSTYARFRFTSGGGVLNLPCYGPAPNGEVEDYKVVIETELVPKWSQQPHPPYEGFDAASDLWLHEEEPGIKWEQMYDSQLIAWHAHDWGDPPGMPNYVQLILANDWQCEGGVVTDFHWWGAFEDDDPGAGLAGFHLSIHRNSAAACLPGAVIWEADIPIANITVTNTGVRNNGGVGNLIYRYDYILPTPFEQTEGEYYWFDVSALSVDPANDPCLWGWQATSDFRLCPSAWMQKDSSGGVPWTSFDDVELAFRVTSEPQQQEEVNKVVADDFISDGRPIEAVNWWGSYLDEYFMPYEPVEPYIIDGWIVSFHHESEVNPMCPPDAIAGEDPTVLGLYFAPRDAVEIVSMGYQDCLGHEVFEYFVKLEDCCLLCSEVDPRDGGVPAEPEAFLEVCGFGYWLDIQAVVGAEWIPPDCDIDYTGHLPSPSSLDGHFWGWHTSYEEKLEDACTGGIVDFALNPANCWDYGNWDKQQWECPWVAPPVNMAFELLTADPPPPPCFVAIDSVGEHGDANGEYPANIGELDVDVAPGDMTIEPRMIDATAIQPGLTDVYIRVEFNKNIAMVVLSGDPNGDAVWAIAGRFVDIHFTTLPSDKTCYTFDLAGTTAMDGTVFGSGPEVTTFCICYIEADIDQSGLVNGGDSNKVIMPGNWLVAADLVAAYGPMVDCNRSGKTDGGDFNKVIMPGNWDPSGTPLTAADCP